MPSYTITKPDKSEFTIDSPIPLTQEQIMGLLNENAPPAASPAQKSSQGLSLATGGATDTGLLTNPGMPQPGGVTGRITQALGQSALPIMGQVGGGALGGLASPYTFGIVNPVTGEMAGGAAGEWANQKLGITEPSNTQIVMAGAAPLVGRATGAIINKGIKILGPAVRQMHEMGAKEAESIPSQYLQAKGVYPTETPALYGAAKMAGGVLPMDEVTQTINDLTKQIPDKGQIGDTLYNKFRGEVAKLNNTIASNPQGLDLDTFQKTMSAIGNLKYVAGRAGTANESKFAGLYASMWKTLNEAADNMSADAPGASILKEAINSAKSSLVAEDLAGHINKNIRYRVGSGDSVGVNGAAIMNAIEGDKLLMKTMDPNVYQNEIKPILEKINKIPAMPPPEGTNYGSGRGIVRGAIGGMIGGAFGSPRVGAEVAISSIPIISKALQTDVGRSFLNKILDSTNGEITKKSLSLLAGIVRANTATPNIPPEIANRFNMGGQH